MDATARYQYTNVVLAALALAHALLTWPLRATLALAVGGALVAFVAEFAVIELGMLEHAMAPKIAGVPVAVVLVWPAIVYISLQFALLVTAPGVTAALLAAALGTAFDVLTDPQGVAEGVWSYPEHPLSRPRFFDVPLWNFVGWFVIVAGSAMIPISVGL